MPISSGENVGMCVFDGDEEEFVGDGEGDGVGDSVGDCVVGDGVVGDGVVGDEDGDGVGESVGDGVGDGVGDCVVGDGVGDGVGGFVPEHLTGGLHGPELRHAGHFAPLHAELGDSSQPYLPVMWSLMTQMPAAAPDSPLSSNRLRMFQQKRLVREGMCRRGSAIARRGIVREGVHAQVVQLRELAERIWDGATDLQHAQVPANVATERLWRGALGERIFVKRGALSKAGMGRKRRTSRSAPSSGRRCSEWYHKYSDSVRFCTRVRRERRCVRRVDVSSSHRWPVSSTAVQAFTRAKERAAALQATKREEREDAVRAQDPAINSQPVPRHACTVAPHSP